MSFRLQNDSFVDVSGLLTLQLVKLYIPIGLFITLGTRLLLDRLRQK